jgi:signal transduction histidine kinase
VTDTATLAARYASALEGYLAGGEEEALQDAYQVGRLALESGLGPLVLFSIHRDVVAKLPPQPIDPGDFVAQSTTVFIETLAPFEMAYASFDEASAAVAELSAMLERDAALVGGLRERLDRVHETSAARRRLIADIVTAQEQERRRIAGEVHDDAVQAITVVSLRLGLLKRELSDPQQLEAINELEGSVTDAIGSLRRLIAGLAPPQLDDRGLAPAVRFLLEDIEARFGLKGRLESRLDAEPGQEARAIAFRIAQEAIVNARKHGRPSRIDVLLESHDGGVLARIVDDGAGFAVREALGRSRPGHLGLGAMRERAQLVGGWLNIESDKQGTSVEFWIPDA